MSIADHILILHRALRTVVEERDGQYRETRRRPEQTADHRKHNQLTFHELNIRRCSESASLAGIFLPTGYEHNKPVGTYSDLKLVGRLPQRAPGSHIRSLLEPGRSITECVSAGSPILNKSPQIDVCESCWAWHPIGDAWFESQGTTADQAPWPPDSKSSEKSRLFIQPWISRPLAGTGRVS